MVHHETTQCSTRALALWRSGGHAHWGCRLSPGPAWARATLRRKNAAFGMLPPSLPEGACVVAGPAPGRLLLCVYLALGEVAQQLRLRTAGSLGGHACGTPRHSACLGRRGHTFGAGDTSRTLNLAAAETRGEEPPPLHGVRGKGSAHLARQVGRVRR